MRITQPEVYTYPHLVNIYPQFYKHFFILDIHTDTYAYPISDIHLSTPPTTSTTIKYMIKGKG